MVQVEEILVAVAQEQEIALQYTKTQTWKKKRKRTDSKMCGRVVKQVQVTVKQRQQELEVSLTSVRIDHKDRVLSEISPVMFTLSRNQRRTNNHLG